MQAGLEERVGQAAVNRSKGTTGLATREHEHRVMGQGGRGSRLPDQEVGQETE